MAYFPFFVDLSNKKGLVVGGGTVALRKIEKLLDFGAKITVISPEIDEKIVKMQNVQVEKRKYIKGDENSYFFVIGATNNRDVNKIISKNCKEKNIPVNIVDDPELCTFLFPCLVKEGKLTVGISTSGSSPTAAIEIKKKVREMIPNNFDEILDYLSEERKKLKKTVATEEERSLILKHLFMEKIKF